MAIYKPSNFYPHLQEVDLTDINGNIFSCQVNTDGAMVAGAKLTISSEDNVIVYENLYQFAYEQENDEIIKDFVENKGFLELWVGPYSIDDENISFNQGETLFYRKVQEQDDTYTYYNEYGENERKISFDDVEEAEEINEIVSKDKTTIITQNIETETYIKNNIITIQNLNFITLTPFKDYDERKNYCPYNLYNVQLKDAYCFGLKFVNKETLEEKLYQFNNVECEKIDDSYTITIKVPNDIDINNETKSLYDCYIVLLNDKDYMWDVKIYEHLFSEEINKGTLITDGYVTGSTKSVLWWDNNKQSENTIFNKKEIKEDYYVEVIADQNNSDLFEEQIKMGRITEGNLTSNNVNDDKNSFKFIEKLVDSEMYNLDNLFLRVQFINDKPVDNRIKADNYFKIKQILKQNNQTFLTLEDSIIQKIIIDYLKPPTVFYRKVQEQDDSYTYYDEYGENGCKIFFNTESEAEEITEITSKDGTTIITQDIETEEYNQVVKYSIVYKQREKITWVTENLGFDKNINKIEVENDFDINMIDDAIVDIYGGNNKNTNSSFFGVRDSDINVNDIYVRFPGYQGADFNGNAVNDTLEYYEELGDAEPIYEKGASTPVELVSNIGLQGNFYNSGLYYPYDEQTRTGSETPIPWSQNVFQPISLYGKNVSYKAFENNSNLQTYGYINVFNPQNKGTAYCNYGFAIELSCCDSITINGDISYISGIPGYSKNSYKTYGILFFYIDSEDNKWKMYAVQKTWRLGYLDDDNIWNFPDYPIDRHSDGDGYWHAPAIEDQIAKRYEIGNIDSIKINYGGSTYDDYNPWFQFYYYNSSYFVGNDTPDSKPPIHPSEEPISSPYSSCSKRYYKEDSSSSIQYFYPRLVTIPESYCKLFKVTSYDYETGEFVLAGGLERSILNTDRYEVWQRVASENMSNEYNITEIAYSYTRIYPPHDKYDDVAYVGDTKILKEGLKIINNTNNQIFIQPNTNFYSDEYNYPYLILDNYNQRIDFPYSKKIYDEGLTIQDRTINKLDGSQWLLKYTSNLNTIPKSGMSYKLYMDCCKSTPSNWFYGRYFANITMRVGEYNYVKKQIDEGYVKKVDYNLFKNQFNDITNKKIGRNCLIQCVDAYFMATYDQLSIPVKRYRYKVYDSSMALLVDSGYIYDTDLSYPVKGLRNEEIYLLKFELEDQLGYIYNYEEKIIVKYVEYETNEIQLHLTVKESQGCVLGDIVTMKQAVDDIIAQRDTYDEYGNQIKKGTIIKKDTIYAELCTLTDFQNFGCGIMDNIYVYRRNNEKLLSFVCQINLSLDKIIIGKNNQHKYSFIDYGVYNDEYYNYIIILKQSDLSEDNHYANMQYIYTESRCKTYFNGWILVDIEKDEMKKNFCVSDFVWNFKYNLESQELTQNTSVAKWDNLGPYANVHIGQRNYTSSGLSCLLGDVGTYLTYDGENIKEKFGYFEKPYSYVDYEDVYNIYTNEVLTNNIDKYLEWKKFVANGKPKLLKDYKGNIWIVQILENSNIKNNDVSKEQVYTISFNWVEIMNWRKYPILGKNASYDVDDSERLEIDEILSAWNYIYTDNDINYNLIRLKDTYDFDSYSDINNAFFVNGIITLDSKSMYGILNQSYYEDQNEKIYFSTLSNEDIESFYETYKSEISEYFISPFMIIDNLGNVNYKYPDSLQYLKFEQNLRYENNSIDFICCGMDLHGIDIVLGDDVNTARYAFAKTKISTNNQYNIFINTKNYINTYGMLDDIEIEENNVITIKWLDSVDDPDLVTYAELYERYWDNPQIILDCSKLNFVISEWTLENSLEDISEIVTINEEEYKKIILKSYDGPNDGVVKTSLYIPKFIMIDGERYIIELDENFYIR